MENSEDIWMGVGEPVEPQEPTSDPQPEPIDPIPEPDPTADPVPEPEPTDSQADPEPSVPETSVFDTLKEQGFEFEDEQGLIEALKLKQEAEQKYADTVSKVSQYEEDEDIKALNAFKEAGEGDLLDYLTLRNADFDKMDDESVLWEEFKISNQENFEYYSEAYMKMTFAEKLKEYSVERPKFIDDDEKSAWEAENKQLLEFKNQKKTGDINKARAELNQRKEKYAKLPTPTGKSNESVIQEREAFQAKVQTTLNDFKPIDIPISDKEEESFKLAADDSTKAVIESIANDPQELLSMVGIKEDGSFDYETMVRAATLLTHVKNGSLGKLLTDHALDVKNAEIVSRKLENPPADPVAVVPNTKGSEYAAWAQEVGM
jgi:hypothetical protein